MSCDFYRRVVVEGPDLLRRINPLPATATGGQHCPEAADSLQDFLRTGEITPVEADGMSEFRMPSRVTFSRVESLQVVARRMANCTHRVVRAVRSAEQQRHHNLTEHHYFVLFKWQNRVYVGDAFIHQVTTDLDAYEAMIIVDQFELASRNYDVTVVDPMSEPVF